MGELAILLERFYSGDVKALARCITIVENEIEGSEEILTSLRFAKDNRIIGITGPPGAGKSTLINAVIRRLTGEGRTVGIVAIDPTSPFNYGSLLGDRLRMAEHFTNEKVFIRSLATRGSLGGLSAKTIEITDVMRAFGFDLVIVETVGVGQSEVEIAGLADCTIVVLVPEAGDEVQTLKAGIMEIADVFVVNKADREGADMFVSNLVDLVRSKTAETPVIRSVATRGEGIDELISAIGKCSADHEKKEFLLTEKAYTLIRNFRMKNVEKGELQKLIHNELQRGNFNIYLLVKKFYHNY
ncbi:MAG: methylmalonyl Co-A mutase-associated GTPase MeaB [Bacteroidota bacterium]